MILRFHFVSIRVVSSDITWLIIELVIIELVSKLVILESFTFSFFEQSTSSKPNPYFGVKETVLGLIYSSRFVYIRVASLDITSLIIELVIINVLLN